MNEYLNLTKKRVLEAISQGVRFDQRAFNEYRKIEIKTNISKNAEGSVSVKIGKTEVLCGVKMGVGEPYPDHESEGTMMTSMEFHPISSSEFSYGPPGVDAIETARIIDRGIRESGFIDFHKLCIKEGEKVWNIFIDLVILNEDGNLIDAGAIGALIALKLARLPFYDEETGRLKYGEFTDNPLPLTENMPVTTTIYRAGNHFFVDPTREEENAAESRLTFEISGIGKKDVINAMQKGGEVPFTKEELKEMIELAKQTVKNINNIIESTIKDSKNKSK